MLSYLDEDFDKVEWLESDFWGIGKIYPGDYFGGHSQQQKSANIDQTNNVVSSHPETSHAQNEGFKENW